MIRIGHLLGLTAWAVIVVMRQDTPVKSRASPLVQIAPPLSKLTEGALAGEGAQPRSAEIISASPDCASSVSCRAGWTCGVYVWGVRVGWRQDEDR